MRFIKQLLQKLYPERNDIETMSLLSLTTSNPVYLIFNQTSPVPEWVIHTVNKQYKEIFTKHQELYSILGHTIAEPLLFIHHQQQFYFIEKGLNGSPWFQLNQRIQSKQQWQKIKEQASNTLILFQHAVLKSSFGQHTILLGESLRNQYKHYLNINSVIPTLSEKVEQYAKQLDQLLHFTSFSQHGDYCLNNLLFHNEHVYIIDFEDIDLTTAPLHDEFSLAISYYLLINSQNSKSIHAEINFCVSQSYWCNQFSQQEKQALFLHHLLLRLGYWSSNNKRQQFKTILMEMLIKFIQDPNYFIE
jgi:hypothetical protein